MSAEVLPFIRPLKKERKDRTHQADVAEALDDIRSLHDLIVGMEEKWEEEGSSSDLLDKLEEVIVFIQGASNALEDIQERIA